MKTAFSRTFFTAAVIYSRSLALVRATYKRRISSEISSREKQAVGR